MARKLNKAPLQEVIFELRWAVLSSQELSKFNFLHGDLFNLLKDSLPFREQLVLPEIPAELLINNPVYRFRPKEAGYPLIQVGPGILTTNTIDEDYLWKNFSGFTNNTVSQFLKVYSFEPDTKLSLSLRYIDFLPFSFSENNVFDFINTNLQLNTSQNFFSSVKNPGDANFSFSYDTDFGTFNLILSKGKNKDQVGIAIHFRMSKISVDTKIEDIIIWINNAHKICSDSFINLTKGKLYDSFI
jgi:uncharacterized protein (TIGR04255 family)